jgi:DNA-binding beta-propeller fold protein YncE
MHLKLTSSKVILEPGQVLTLDDAEGVHIRPDGAKVWVTEEGDCSDFVVNPGEDFVVSHAGRTVVQAIDKTWVDLQEAA